MGTSKTTRISAILPSSLANEIKKISNVENITQSSIIKKALEFWFQNRLSKDLKSLSRLDFNDLPSENDWTLIQSKI